MKANQRTINILHKLHLWIIYHGLILSTVSIACEVHANYKSLAKLNSGMNLIKTLYIICIDSNIYVYNVEVA